MIFVDFLPLSPDSLNLIVIYGFVYRRIYVLVTTLPWLIAIQSSGRLHIVCLPYDLSVLPSMSMMDARNRWLFLHCIHAYLYIMVKMQ